MTLSIVLGTYNRRAMLERAIQSIRDTVGSVPYEIVVVDGGSTDGSRAWLAEQEDVVLLGQRGPLTGAVRAFNLGFHYALESGSQYIGHLNDDVVCQTPNMWTEAIERIKATPAAGACAFAFDTWPERGWTHDRVFGGKAYVNYGVLTREACEMVARAQGDVTGRKVWNPTYHTYAADSEAGVWMAKLGYGVITAHDLHVHDESAQDELRETNVSQGDQQHFYDRWAEIRNARRDDWPAGIKYLHLGCGTKRIIADGWLNVDGLASVGPDLVLDVNDMTGVPSAELAWIYSCHMIEHLHPDRLLPFLRECYRCLRPTGRLTLSTISFPKIYKNRYETHSNGSAWNAALYGETLSTDHPFAAHRQAFDEQTLGDALRNAGFEHVREWSPSGYPDIRALNDFSTSCRAVSVLMEGIK